MNIDELLRLMVEQEASDLHLRAAAPPVLRIDGELRRLTELPDVTPQLLEEMVERMTTEDQRDALYRTRELDLGYSVSGLARFRVNAFFQRGTISIAIRQLSLRVPTIDELGLPSVCKTLALKSKGLVLVTGPTGCGKSTTLAAMINHLNNTLARHLITIEDPIEYIHRDIKCLVAQRDLGDDTFSFAAALRHALRQDPDVILVGEMRDLETISTALTAAETGHLVLSTVHTVSAPQTIERVVDVSPPHQQPQIRFQLSLVLEGVLSQLLLPLASGKGRIGVFEVMVSTEAIRNLIRESKTDQMVSYLQTGSQYGMQTMDQALEDLVMSGKVTVEEASMRHSKPDEMERKVSTLQQGVTLEMNQKGVPQHERI